MIFILFICIFLFYRSRSKLRREVEVGVVQLSQGRLNLKRARKNIIAVILGEIQVMIVKVRLVMAQVKDQNIINARPIATQGARKRQGIEIRDKKVKNLD